jgi:hypothetical protein
MENKVKVTTYVCRSSPSIWPMDDDLGYQQLEPIIWHMFVAAHVDGVVSVEMRTDTMFLTLEYGKEEQVLRFIKDNCRVRSAKPLRHGRPHILEDKILDPDKAMLHDFLDIMDRKVRLLAESVYDDVKRKYNIRTRIDQAMTDPLYVEAVEVSKMIRRMRESLDRMIKELP